MKQKKPITNLPHKRLQAYRVSLALYLIYLLIQAWWHFQFAPPTGDMPAITKTFLFVSPLLLLLPGIIQGKASTYLFLSALIMGYFSLAFIKTYTPGANSVFGSFEMIYLSGFFVSVCLFARWQGRTDALNTAAETDSALK